MNKIYELDEFINDERFITQEHKQIYLTSGKYLSTKQKNIIKQKFECYFESFEWFDRKNKKNRILLGDAREQAKTRADKRTTQQQTEIALIVKQALINFLSLLSERSEQGFDLDSKIVDGYYYTTTFNFLFDLKLVNHYFKEFVRQVEYPTADEAMEELARFNDNHDLEKINRQYNKNYIKVKKYRWTRTFNQALKSFDVKSKYIVTTWNSFIKNKGLENEEEVKTLSHRFMTDDEQAKFEQWEKELLKQDDVEKSGQFKKTTDKTELYDLLVQEYIEKNFQAYSMYKVKGIKIKHYGSVAEVDSNEFLSDYKARTDKESITALYKQYAKAIHLLDYEQEYRKHELVSEFKDDIYRIDVMDQHLIDATRSDETEELIAKMIGQLEQIEIVEELEQQERLLNEFEWSNVNE